MKVLQIINSLGTGGAEKLLFDTIPLYRKAGIEMDILLFWNNDHQFLEILKTLGCCKIFILNNSSNLKDIYHPKNIIKLRKYLKNYDIAHVHLFPAQYYVVFAKLISFSKIKLVFTEHSTGNTRLDNKNYKMIEKFIYHFYKKIICITYEVKKVLSKNLDINKDKLCVIQNGIDLKFILDSPKKNRKEFGFKDSDKILIMVAGFREQKDHDTLLKTLSVLPPEYKLLLVGDGDLRENIENLINELTLNDRVRLIGVRLDVYSLMKMADISILSSHWEGFGLVAAEAMACGTPIIASDVDGLSKVVGNSGLLFEKGNSEELKEKILSLEDIDYYHKISARGINKAKQYDISIMIKNHKDLYDLVYES